MAGMALLHHCSRTIQQVQVQTPAASITATRRAPNISCVVHMLTVSLTLYPFFFLPRCEIALGPCRCQSGHRLQVQKPTLRARA